MDVTTSEVILLGKWKFMGRTLTSWDIGRAKWPCWLDLCMKNQKRCEVYSFKFRAAVQQQCHLTTPMLPLADKSEATGSSSSRGMKSICFIFTKPYYLATSVSVLSRKKKRENKQINQRLSLQCKYRFCICHVTVSATGSRGSEICFKGRWGCLDKSLKQNEVKMEHALVMMWNLMFAFCPAGKRDFRLVIFLVLFFFPPPSFFGKDASGEQKDAGAKRASGLKIWTVNPSPPRMSPQAVAPSRRSGKKKKKNGC